MIYNWYSNKTNVDYYDSYDGDGYEQDYDECRGGMFVEKNLNNNTMTIHDKFREMQELSSHETWKHGKRCCAGNSYVFQDICMVNFSDILIQIIDTF